MPVRFFTRDSLGNIQKPEITVPQLNGSDLFGRLRTSSPFTLFSSHFQFDKRALFWDEVLAVNGTSTFNANQACIDMAVTGENGSRVVRQTKEYMVYEPGRAQQGAFTALFGTPRTNCNQRIGMFDDSDGVFFRLDGSTFGVGIRSSVSGSVVNTLVDQADFNIDKLDGRGLSGKIIDLTKTQLFYIEYQWFGVGTVRFGVFIDGHIIYCHEINHANRKTTVYMKRGSLPVRYEIVNAAATAGAVTMKQICSAVSSEAGYKPSGVTRAADTGIVGLVAASGVERPILSIRLKSTAIRSSIIPINATAMCSTADNFRLRIILNGSLTGASFASVATDSIAELDIAATAVSGGTIISSVYTSNQIRANLLQEIESLLKLAANIAGTSDVVSLTVTGVPAGAVTAFGSLEWQEFY